MSAGKALGFLAGLFGLTALFFTVAQLVVYSPAHFRREYQKYGVAESIGIKTDDLMDVTAEMMDYLYDKREDLVIEATVRGEEREFFNDREKAHMRDVQSIVTLLRGVRSFSLAACILLFLLAKNTGGQRWSFPAGMRAALAGVRWAIVAFWAGGAALAGMLAQNFYKYFLWFHQTFFDNDLWLLDPQTDLLINMVPEGYFRDTALWILGVFLGLSAAALVGISLYLHRSGKKA